MKIKVFNEKSIKKYKTKEKHIVISVQDPNYKFVKLPNQKSRLDWLGLKCYDLDKDTEQFPYSKFIFHESQAKTILKFVNKWKNKVDLICVNCVAGISRSAGIASALSVILNDDDDYFFKNYIPNMLIYQTILREHYGQIFNGSKKPDIKFIN